MVISLSGMPHHVHPPLFSLPFFLFSVKTTGLLSSVLLMRKFVGGVRAIVCDHHCHVRFVAFSFNIKHNVFVEMRRLQVPTMYLACLN